MNRRELLRGCGVVVLGGVAAKLGAEATPAYQWKKLGVMVRADDVMEPDGFFIVPDEFADAMVKAADPARVLTRHDAMKQIERAEFRVLLRGEGRMM